MKKAIKKRFPIWIIFSALAILLLIIVFALIFGGKEQKYVCPDGQVVSDASLCPKQEIKQETKPIEPYCGDEVCEANEKAPECGDCEANIRLENVRCKIIRAQPPYVVDDLEITYDVTNLGDPVYVYPAIDLYAGWSETQCSNKDYLPFYKDWDCPGGCYFLIKDDVNNKKYEDIAYGVNQPSQGTGEIGDNPKCFYYKFYLMPYNPKNPPTYGNERPYESIATWESYLNPCS